MKTQRFDPHAVIPNIEAIAREMTSSSQIGIIIRKVRQLSLTRIFLLGLHNISYLPMLAKKDFATGMKLLCELEILRRPKRSKQYLLHNQITDMAIALKNTRLLEYFFSVASTYGFHPGIISFNPERCIQFLSTFRSIPKNLTIYCPKTSTGIVKFAKISPIRIEWIPETT